MKMNLADVGDRDAEPWFVAADVCAVLGIQNPTDALNRLDEDEYALVSIEGLSRGNAQANVINESGLYSLIMTSRKPDAKKFKKWVTSEVLPAIRKTGEYIAPKVNMAPASGNLELTPHIQEIAFIRYGLQKKHLL